ncbi:hypothetical protein BGZ76_008367, partial [Entomortierella beljakovae]
MIASAFRSRFSVTHHVVDSTTPHRLACNIYKRLSASPASASATPPIIFTHANGFHKEIWEPVMSRMSDRWTSGDMYAFDCRNHADSATMNKKLLKDTFDWYDYARDILSIVDRYNLKKVIGVGHSYGASAFILAETLRPGTFSTIVAVDPTMFPKEYSLNAPFDDHPMAQMTLKRRDAWKTRHEYGLVDVENEDGSKGITLKTPKFQEAVTFALVGTGLSDAFYRLSELEIPILIIGGENSMI